jgi:hypothetical protein
MVDCESPSAVSDLLHELDGDFQALPEALGRLRGKYGAMREILREHEFKRSQASSPKDRKTLQHAFRRIWSSQFPDRPKLRWIYELRGPSIEATSSSIAKGNSGGAEFSEQDRTLGAWWRLFSFGPQAFEMHKTLAGFRIRLAGADVWKAAGKLGQSIDAHLSRRSAHG